MAQEVIKIRGGRTLNGKRRTKNAKAFHDKCENPGNWDTKSRCKHPALEKRESVSR
ncbi:hypothetical protein ACT6QE_07650 [Staphylococcus aureus]